MRRVFNVEFSSFICIFQRLNFIDVATGSLGQGLSCAAGMAYTGKYFDKSEYDILYLNMIRFAI